MDEQFSCASITEGQNCKTADPYIGQVYKGDSGSKSGLKDWTDAMESTALWVGCVFGVLDLLGKGIETKRQHSVFFKTRSVFVFRCSD